MYYFYFTMSKFNVVMSIVQQLKFSTSSYEYLQILVAEKLNCASFKNIFTRHFNCL